LNTKDSDELLDIWQENDRVEWSDTAFDVIKEILIERLGEVPPQNEPIFEYVYVDDKVKDSETYGFSEETLAIVDDENPPDFYDPFEVLRVSKWIDWSAKAMAIVITLQNLLRFSDFKGFVASYFARYPNNLVVYLITLIVLAINTAIGVVITYWLLSSLSRVLRILMQMEFNSRKV
jgi:hypothetical protein